MNQRTPGLLAAMKSYIEATSILTLETSFKKHIETNLPPAFLEEHLEKNRLSYLIGMNLNPMDIGQRFKLKNIHPYSEDKISIVFQNDDLELVILYNNIASYIMHTKSRVTKNDEQLVISYKVSRIVPSSGSQKPALHEELVQCLDSAVGSFIKHLIKAALFREDELVKTFDKRFSW